MKYLKKFNESSDDYYNNQKFAIVQNSVIVYDENGNLVQKYNLEEFTNSEIDELDELMLSRFRAKRYTNPWSPESLNYNYLEYKYTLCKSEDEWYFISMQNIRTNKWSYYRCDQYDGLIKLLNDLSE